MPNCYIYEMQLNSCIYEMQIKGKKENVDKLISYLNSYYEYKENELVECDADKHFFNVFDAQITGEFDSYDNDQEICVVVVGECVHSVSYCMFNDESSFYDGWISDGVPKNFKGTHMKEATKELGLTVEIFSEELDFGVMEHYIVRNGEIELHECKELNYIYDEDGDILGAEGGMEWKYTI